MKSNFEKLKHRKENKKFINDLKLLKYQRVLFLIFCIFILLIKKPPKNTNQNFVFAWD